MHDRELVHVLQGLEDLDAESFSQRHRESLKVVVLDELVEINAQHFKTDEYVAAEGEVVLDADDVLRILPVRVSQRFEDADLDLALFVELLPVLQDLQSDGLLLLVVVATDDDTERSTAQLLLDLITEVDMVLGIVQIVGLVVVEAVVVHAVLRLLIRVLVLARELILDKCANALKLTVEIEVINGLKRGHFVFFELGHLTAIFLNEVARCHGERRTALACGTPLLTGALLDGALAEVCVGDTLLGAGRAGRGTVDARRRVLRLTLR